MIVKIIMIIIAIWFLIAIFLDSLGNVIKRNRRSVALTYGADEFPRFLDWLLLQPEIEQLKLLHFWQTYHGILATDRFTQMSTLAKTIDRRGRSESEEKSD